MTFVEKLIANSQDIWQEYLTHPFTLGVVKGSLERQLFKNYIIEDSIYLREYARIFALGMYNAKRREDMIFFYERLKFINQGEGGAQAAPHLAVFIRQYIVPVPADKRATHQVGQLQIGENMLQDPSWQPPGHPCASSGCSSVRRAGGAATGCRCCAQTGGASTSTGRSRHYEPAPYRRHQPSEDFHLTP